MPSPVSSGPTSHGTNIGCGLIRSESTNTTMSPLVAASERHSASPLPGRVATSGNACSRLTTRAPAAMALISVSSVEPESSTISSSTRPPRSRTSGEMLSITDSMVSSSSRAGSTTEIVRPALAATNSPIVHLGRFHSSL